MNAMRKYLPNIEKRKQKICLVLVVILSVLFIYLKLAKPQAIAQTCDCDVKAEIIKKSPNNVQFNCYYRLEDKCAVQYGGNTYYGRGILYALVLYENESGIFVYWVPKSEGAVGSYASVENPPDTWTLYFSKEFSLDQPGKYYFICEKFGRPTWKPSLYSTLLPEWQEQFAACALQAIGKNPLLAFKPENNKNYGVWLNHIKSTDYYREGNNYIIFKKTTGYRLYCKVEWDGYDKELYLRSGWNPNDLRCGITEEYICWDRSCERCYIRCGYGAGYAVETYELKQVTPPYTNETKFKEEVKKSILDKILELIAKIIEQLFKLLGLK